MADAINPSHYKQGKVECIDAIESATVNKTGLEAVCVANVIKYLWRYEAKNGLEDVRKAQWYLAKLIDYLEAKNKKPIQHFKPQTIADPLDNMPCIPTPHYPCEAVTGTAEDVKIYNAPQDITGTLKADNNNNICLDEKRF
jgi:hypothetical protein